MAELIFMGEPMVEFVRCEDARIGEYYRKSIGGDVCNAAVACARQGGEVGFLTALGNDVFGDAIRELWREEGIDARDVPSRSDPTGVYFVTPHAEARQFDYLRKGSAASLFTPADLPQARIGKAAIVHASGITLAIGEGPRRAVMRAAEMVREGGGFFSFDTNLRLKLWDIDTAREAIFAAAGQADILFPSEDEAEQLLGLTGPDEIADAFLDMGAGMVVLKRGAKGAWLRGNGLREEIPPAPSDPVDSTGAGDAFAGSFLAWYAETKDAAHAARKAAEVAAAVVSGLGAIAPIPRR